MKRANRGIIIRIPTELHRQMLIDLSRPHTFAAERVGFLYTRTACLTNGTTIVTANSYSPIADDLYIDDSSVGAKIGSVAIRASMQNMLNKGGGCFHVHLHEHVGEPSPSFTDVESLPSLIQSISNVAGQDELNGYIILSKDSAYASIYVKRELHFRMPSLISIVGRPMKFIVPGAPRPKPTGVYQRQDFLGTNSQFLFRNIRIGLVGYGGGGSHIGQQVAHLGFGNVVVFDNDRVEGTNLNRLIGAWYRDIKKALLKTTIAKRVMRRIMPTCEVICVNDIWQNQPEFLQQCDIVVGCVDTYAGRQQLEAECRRYLIPYIDIGMDVYQLDDRHSIAGQVILSIPGKPCMNCLGFLTDEKLGKEAAKYGNTGGRPQVVWPNGVLASTAVGVLVDLVTGWANIGENAVYLSYDGNNGTLTDHIRLKFVSDVCSHYPIEATGKPFFVNL